MAKLRIGVAVILLVFSMGSLTAVPAFADDHLFTAVAAGGLIRGESQPFLNGTNNPGRPGGEVTGQGSPLSGEDHDTPAVATEQLPPNANPGNGDFKTNPAWASGKVAPSANSPHPGP